MSLDLNLDKILIIDFGSQFTQLIVRRIRELGVFSELISHKKIKSYQIKSNVKGIILSGGPLNVYQLNDNLFDNNTGTKYEDGKIPHDLDNRYDVFKNLINTIPNLDGVQLPLYQSPASELVAAEEPVLVAALAAPEVAAAEKPAEKPAGKEEKKAAAPVPVVEAAAPVPAEAAATAHRPRRVNANYGSLNPE